MARTLETTLIATAALWAIGLGTCKADDPVRFLVDNDGFGDSAADIEAVCRSAGRQIWQHVDNADGIVIQVAKRDEGPITLFERATDGAFRVRLDTGGQAWSQYGYQFSHETCHVLCGGSDDWPGNLWFEETLCETASLYSLRRMSVEWRTKAPYGNWRDYAPSLGDYASSVIRGREDFLVIARVGLPAYYGTHAAHLRDHPTDREKNGAMAVVLLAMFERDPSHWGAIRWLNPSPSRKGESFTTYLTKWRNAVPERHVPFVEQVAELYGIELDPQCD